MSDMQTWDDFSPSDIPDEIQNELMAMKDREHKDQFRLGRIIMALRSGLKAENVDVPIMRLYKAVGYWAGFSSEHARQCYQVAKNVSPSVERQHPEISFHQWKALTPHCDEPGEYHAKIEAWLDHCEETGVSPTSVDGIRGWLSGDEGKTIQQKRYASTVRQISRLGSDREVPDPIRRVLRYTIQELTTTVKLNNLTEWKVEL
jgi:hypothetical protein